MSTKEKRKNLLKERYKEYRSEGYSGAVSRALSQRSKKPTQKEIAVIEKRVAKNKIKLEETRQKRFLVYQELGYNAEISRALSRRALKVDNLTISKRTGKLTRNKTTKNYIDYGMEQWKREQAIDNYMKKYELTKNKTFKNITNETNYSPHGMLTHTKEFKGENGRLISIIKHDNHISSDQAYYFFYIMLQSGMTYEQTKLQLLTNKEFETYVSKGKREKVQANLKPVKKTNFKPYKRGK